MSMEEQIQAEGFSIESYRIDKIIFQRIYFNPFFDFFPQRQYFLGTECFFSFKKCY